MKRYGLLYAVLVLAAALAGCNNGDPPDALAEEPSLQESMEESSIDERLLQEPERSDSEPEPSSQEEEESEASSEPEPEPEPEPPASPYPDALLTVRVVDRAGNPVPYVGGLLELGVSGHQTLPDGTMVGFSPAAVPLAGTGERQICTGADGGLYLTDNDTPLPNEGTLELYAFYNDAIRQSVPMSFAGLSGEVTVVWEGGPPPTSPPDTTLSYISFRIVDGNGNPLPHVGGNLVRTNDSEASSQSLFARKPEMQGGGLYENLDPGEIMLMTDDDGYLYLEVDPAWEARQPSRICRLHLYAYYDSTISQEHTIELPDPPASYTVTWTQATPPAQRPPQATGLRVFLVDTQGKPVQGVSLGGSPYPRPAPGEMVPGIAMILGESDENGYIRWDEALPGTYDLRGQKDGLVQQFELVMPADKVMADIVLVWNP